MFRVFHTFLEYLVCENVMKMSNVNRDVIFRYTKFIVFGKRGGGGGGCWLLEGGCGLVCGLVWFFCCVCVIFIIMQVTCFRSALLMIFLFFSSALCNDFAW